MDNMKHLKKKDDLEDLIRFVMNDIEVIASGATSYQIACVLVAIMEFLDEEVKDD